MDVAQDRTTNCNRHRIEAYIILFTRRRGVRHFGPLPLTGTQQRQTCTAPILPKSSNPIVAFGWGIQLEKLREFSTTALLTSFYYGQETVVGYASY